MSFQACLLLLLIATVSASPSLRKRVFQGNNVMQQIDDALSNGGSLRDAIDFGDDPRSRFLEAFSHALYIVCDAMDMNCQETFTWEVTNALNYCPGWQNTNIDVRVCFLDSLYYMDNYLRNMANEPFTPARQVITVEDLETMVYTWRDMKYSMSYELSDQLLGIVRSCARPPPTPVPTSAPAKRFNDNYLPARQCIKDILDQGGYDDDMPVKKGMTSSVKRTEGLEDKISEIRKLFEQMKQQK